MVGTTLRLFVEARATDPNTSSSWSLCEAHGTTGPALDYLTVLVRADWTDLCEWFLFLPT